MYLLCQGYCQVFLCCWFPAVTDQREFRALFTLVQQRSWHVVIRDINVPSIGIGHRPIQLPIRIHQSPRLLVRQVHQRPASEFPQRRNGRRQSPLRTPSHRLIHLLRPPIAANAIPASVACTASNACSACVDCIAIAARHPPSSAPVPPIPTALHPPPSRATPHQLHPGVPGRDPAP